MPLGLDPAVGKTAERDAAVTAVEQLARHEACQEAGWLSAQPVQAPQ